MRAPLFRAVAGPVHSTVARLRAPVVPIRPQEVRDDSVPLADGEPLEPFAEAPAESTQGAEDGI